MSEICLKSGSLHNASTCALLALNLENLSEPLTKEGNDINNSLLLEAYPNITSNRQFKIKTDMPKTNLLTYLNPLSCSKEGTSLNCQKSQNCSQAELRQFSSIWEDKKAASTGTNPTKVNFLGRRNVNLGDRFGKWDKIRESGLTNMPITHDYESVPKEYQTKRPKCSNPLFTTARAELERVMPSRRNMSEETLYVNEENFQVGHRNKTTLRRSVKSKFVSPLLSRKEGSIGSEENIESPPGQIVDERLKNIEPKMVELIMAEIVDNNPNTTWDDIAGLHFAKSAIQEAVVWPLLRPDIFTGLRRPPKGILLFGPPGTGKTLIGKCVASQSKSTFFSISASSLTSKWIGDGEKMVRALFQVARVYQPAVIFIDEVDSLLTQRNDQEHECSRRIKTEFLVQLDGATTDSEERLLIVGATNRPQELDEAARRRFVKRLYIPLPEYEARRELLKKLMSNEKCCLASEQFEEIAKLTEGYSGADIKNLCSEASLEPVRSIGFSNIANIQASDVRPLDIADFEKALKRVRPSVAQSDLLPYMQWDKTYGSGT